jgi:hypothetical protein
LIFSACRRIDPRYIVVHALFVMRRLRLRKFRLRRLFLLLSKTQRHPNACSAQDDGGAGVGSFIADYR